MQATQASTTFVAALQDLAFAADVQRELTAKTFPEVYAVIPDGDCMEPLYKDNEPLIVSSTATLEPGDTVIIHFAPGFRWSNGYEAIVKRLDHPLFGMVFPWQPPEGSNVAVPVSVSQLNPPTRYNIPPHVILAIHKVLGPGKRTVDGRVVAAKRLLEAA